MLAYLKFILLKKYLSPGNLIVTAGGILAFVGMTAYFTDSVNLSVPTFFYGVPIFLIGLGLKTSEIPPVELLTRQILRQINLIDQKNYLH